MPDRLIPISRKQHDSIKNLRDAIAENTAQLQTGINWIMQTVDEELGEVAVKDAVCRDGVYSLLIALPELPETPAQDTTG